MPNQTNGRRVLEDLLKRKSEIEAQTNAPDALTQLNNEIERVQAGIFASDEAERVRQVTALREQGRTALLDVIAAAKVLEQKLSDFHAVGAELSRRHARPFLGDGGLDRCLKMAFAYFKMVDPTLLGLPPKPTAAELRRLELQASIEQGENFIKRLEEEKKKLHGNPADVSTARMESDKLIAERRELIARMKDQLAGKPDKGLSGE